MLQHRKLIARGLTTCSLSLGIALLFSDTAVAAAAEDVAKIGTRLPIWSTIPFAGILLSLAIFPQLAPKWWHHHFPKVSAFWGLIFGVPFLIAFRGEAVHELFHVYSLEYLPFVIILWALFSIAGGVYVKGTLKGSPGLNVVILLIGTLIASWIGTTGASMMLIRPVLRANAWRKRKVHIIIFFIFLVSNIGGSLTPLGDPPLFLGFLIGVPFFWTLGLLPEMIFVTIPLLLIFFIIDRFYYSREEGDKPTDSAPLGIEGVHNFLFLAGVVAAVLISGVWDLGTVTILGIHIPIVGMARDGFLILMGVLSLITTSKQIHKDNEFTWFPIKEVAILFAGIFTTIVPAIAILKAGESGSLGFVITSLQSPSHYFWVTGSLSSFLDNAPSYLTLLNSALGKFFPGVPTRESIDMLISERHLYLQGISVGAVFWGAVTYVGNAPNFMVKSISEEAGVRMPSFFGYMFKYSIPILIPLFILVTLVFF